MISTYIFDLDDTIIDTSIYKKIYPEVINRLLKQCKLSEIELQEIMNEMKKSTGMKSVDTYDLCKKLQSTEIYYAVLQRYVRYSAKLVHKKIPAFFRKISDAGKKVGVVSRAQERTIKVFLDHFMLPVDFIVSGDKKTVLFWVSLQKKHQILSRETMVVDNDNEILHIAKHAGYQTLHVEHLESLEGFSV